jgi:hypothetical protein
MGSGRLSSMHHIHTMVQQQQQQHQHLSPSRTLGEHGGRSPHEDEAPEDHAEDPFQALASSYAMDDGNVEQHLLELVDPYSILQRTWLQCCGGSVQVSRFVTSLKKCAGCSEDEAIQTALRVDIMVSEFRVRGAFAWNLVDGVGPLEEDGIVESVLDVLGESGVWADKIAAVWRCALVHLDK